MIVKQPMPSDLKKILPQVREQVVLAPFTSFGIGGPARYFLVAKTATDVIAGIEAAKQSHHQFFLLGGGTNLLVSDQGFPGLVIKMELDQLAFDHARASVGSGVLLQTLIDQGIERGLAGLELMSGVGGTVGGAVRGNAGAFGQTIGGCIITVSAYVAGRTQVFTRAECQFRYRHSIFKTAQAVVLSAELELLPGDRAALRKQADVIIQTRQARYNVNWQCAGCVFKNIDLKSTPVNQSKIMKQLDVSEAEYRKVTQYGKLPVSFITDRLGLKGQQIGGAKIADEHGAFILNIGQATAEDVIMLMSIIKTKVRNILGIQLEPEIELVGF